MFSDRPSSSNELPDRSRSNIAVRFMVVLGGREPSAPRGPGRPSDTGPVVVNHTPNHFDTFGLRASALAYQPTSYSSHCPPHKTVGPARSVIKPRSHPSALFGWASRKVSSLRMSRFARKYASGNGLHSIHNRQRRYSKTATTKHRTGAELSAPRRL